MRYISIFILSLIMLLSSCGKTATNNNSTGPSPYPSVPLSATESGANAEKALLPPPEAKTTDSFIAKGTEPFWSLDVEKNVAVLSRPGTGNTVTENFNVIQEDKGAIISIRGVKGDIFLSIVKSECNDGMSEQKYAYSATLNVGAEVLRGCANRK